MDWEKIKPSFWMNTGNLKHTAAFLDSWFQYVLSLLEWPLRQFDAATAEMFVVNLLAWERDIDRFSGEPDWLYRRRVKYAEQNVKDAGSMAGFKRIWERMELGSLDIEERIPGRDWDIINLTVTEHALSQYPDLIKVILSNYAITCRRYELTSVAIDQIKVRFNYFENTSDYLVASL